MRRRVALGALATASVLGLFCTGPEPMTDPRWGSPRPGEPSCMEDEPCWDCETMGNRVCGVSP